MRNLPAQPPGNFPPGRWRACFLGTRRDALPIRKPTFGSTTEGADRNRTGVNGFAGRRVTTPPRRRRRSSVASGRSAARTLELEHLLVGRSVRFADRVGDQPRDEARPTGRLPPACRVRVPEQAGQAVRGLTDRPPQRCPASPRRAAPAVAEVEPSADR